MLSTKHTAYGSAPFLKAKEGKPGLKMSILVVLAGCLLVPLLLFATTFWLMSFDMRYQSESLTNIVCWLLLLVPVVFAYLSLSLWKSRSDVKPMTLLAFMCLLGWALGSLLGSNNFHVNMQPYYDLTRMNVYPSVDPANFSGQQLMDAGQILFIPGTRLAINKSMGFIDGDVYCAAPIVSGNSTQSTFDFWAVGMNCCSGHSPDFQCGEFSNPHATKGLRLLDKDKVDMFNLVVNKASAEFDLKVRHPIFLHWLSHPEAELQAYTDDGWRLLVTATFGFVAVQLCVIVCAAILFARI